MTLTEGICLGVFVFATFFEFWLEDRLRGRPPPLTLSAEEKEPVNSSPPKAPVAED